MWAHRLCAACSTEVKGTEAGPLSEGLGQSDLPLSSLLLGQARQSLHRVPTRPPTSLLSKPPPHPTIQGFPGAPTPSPPSSSSSFIFQ